MKLVSSDLRKTTPPFAVVAAIVVGIVSFAIDKLLVESVDKREGVCDREGTFDEQRDDDGLEFKFSIGISSEVGREMTRGLDSL